MVAKTTDVVAGSLRGGGLQWQGRSTRKRKGRKREEEREERSSFLNLFRIWGEDFQGNTLGEF